MAVSLEFLDAQTYQVVFRKSLVPKVQMFSISIDLSQDGRYLKFTVRESQERGRQPRTPYLYEIVPQ